MVLVGLPAEDVAAVRAAVSDMWPERPGGWVHDLPQLAARYAVDGTRYLAALGEAGPSSPAGDDDAV